MDVIVQKWHDLCEKVGPVLVAIGSFFKKVWEVLGIIWAYIVKLRKLFAAIPVAWAAIMLALRNATALPESVGFNLQLDGGFAMEVSRELAVLGPVALTALCLFLMFCSKRILTPWVVSAITLIVPVIIWVVNVFPT